MSDKYKTPTHFVHAVVVSLQKARSGAVESAGEDLAHELFPGLFDEQPMSLTTVSATMVADGRVASASDAANLAYLLRRDPVTYAMVSASPVGQGMEDFPTFMQCIERWQS